MEAKKQDKTQKRQCKVTQNRRKHTNYRQEKKRTKQPKLNK